MKTEYFDLNIFSVPNENFNNLKSTTYKHILKYNDYGQKKTEKLCSANFFFPKMKKKTSQTANFSSTV